MTFSISHKNPDINFDKFVSELLAPFLIDDPKNHKQKAIEAIKQYDQECKQYFESFINKYGLYIPRLKSLKEFFKPLEPTHYFAMLPNVNISQSELYKITLKLKSLNEGLDYEVLLKEFDKKYKPLYDNYDVRVFGDRRKTIKGFNKKKCRFCQRVEGSVSFEKKSHAISEGLGNKMIKNLDECDDCNEFFSRELEPYIISYLSIFRTLYSIKGKGGKKSLKNERFKIEKVNNVFTINLFEGITNLEMLQKEIRLEKLGQFYPNKLYKSLVKYFISVIDTHQLEYFQNSINWIMEKETERRANLPFVGIRINLNEVYYHPMISTFIRFSSNEKIPFAFCEFKFTVFTFLFIIPFSSKDQPEIWTKNKTIRSLKNVYYFNANDNWTFQDFSFSDKKNINFTFNFEE